MDFQMKERKEMETDIEQLKYECEQYTLRKLAFYLEKIGKDLPPELPPLNKENKYALNAEWLTAHGANPDEAIRTFERNIASTTTTSLCFEMKFFFRYAR